MFVPRSVGRGPAGRKPRRSHVVVPMAAAHAVGVSPSEASQGSSRHGATEETPSVELCPDRVGEGAGIEGVESSGHGAPEETPSVELCPDRVGEGARIEGVEHSGQGEEKEGEEEDEEEEVVSYSKLQRWPSAGEPVCVVCGRYGAYVVDQTDADICSLECKGRHLQDLGRPIMASSRVEGGGGEGGGGGREGEGAGGGAGGGGESCKEDGDVAAPLSEAQVATLRKELSIEVKGDNVPHPVPDFQLLPLPDTMRSNLVSMGCAMPTPVQMQAIPAALSGRDLLVCATTGSGKTLSFLLPLLLRASSSPRPSPTVLVLAPTRELCMQIEEQAKQLVRGIPDMRTALLVGGLPLANQLHRLRTGVQVVVATPARLLDILENHAADIELSFVDGLVLDEVDCLLHMGFEEQVQRVQERLPRVRQTLMFSATIPPKIEKMAAELMSSPLCISVGVPGAPCESVKHTVIWVEEAAKKKRLFSCLTDKKLFRPPAVVFVNSKMGTLLLAEAINKVCANVSAVGIHGDMAQERRSAVVEGLREGKYAVVVSTGLLARGVDLVHVQQVFVFDIPFSMREFIHQIGRAGRLGSPGHAISFINNENKSVFAELVGLLEPLGVCLPPLLLHSPHLALQRESRTRKRRREGGDQHWDGRGFYDPGSLMDLLKGGRGGRRRS